MKQDSLSLDYKHIDDKPEKYFADNIASKSHDFQHFAPEHQNFVSDEQPPAFNIAQIEKDFVEQRQSIQSLLYCIEQTLQEPHADLAPNNFTSDHQVIHEAEAREWLAPPEASKNVAEQTEE